MNKRNNKLLLTFVLGLLTALFISPFLRTMGLSFDVLLVYLFGEDSIWALPFSLLVIATIVFGVKFISKTAA